MKRNKMFSHFFKKNKRYDLVSQSNESQQKPNAHFQAVGFDVNMDLLKKLEPYRKYYTKETSQSNSIEESYNRLSTAAEQAKIISKNFEAVDSNRISGNSMEGFKREMVNKLKDKFYLSDYLHYWLNIETEKSKNLKRTSTNSPWIEGLEENIRLRYTLLYNCLDGSLPNIKLNEHAVEEIISRIAPHHYKINEEIERYYHDRKAVLSKSTPRISQCKTIHSVKSEISKQASDKNKVGKQAEKQSRKDPILSPTVEKLI